MSSSLSSHDGAISESSSSANGVSGDILDVQRAACYWSRDQGEFVLRKAFGRAAVMIPAPLVAAVFLLAVGHARSSEVTPTAAVQSSAKSIAAGGWHTCALTKAGRGKCWGFNGHGQLGDGTHRFRTGPVRVHGLSGEVRAIAAGYAHTCAVTRAG